MSAPAHPPKRPSSPDYPPPPPSARAYVDALGIEVAIDLMLNFGGSEVYVTDNPQGKGEVERVIGRANVLKLAEINTSLKFRMPLPIRWLIFCLYAQGVPVNIIARRLKRSTVNVRRHLAYDKSGGRS